MKEPVKIQNPPEKKKKTFWDKTIDFFFSEDLRKHLVWIVFLGFVLRFIVARNISALGDEMIHGPHAIGFLHSGLISTILHSPLWFYLADLSHIIFGVTMWSTRFPSVFYGTLTIIAVYLLASKIFGRKTGIISAFLLSISYYTIRYTLIEMDMTFIFFTIFALYLFILSMEKNKFPFLSAICLGLASLVKTLSLFFVPAFLIGFFMFKEKERRWKKKNIRQFFFFGVIILLFFSPIIIHNYLWYKDSKHLDVYFAQYFNLPGTRKPYVGIAGYDSGFLFSMFTTGFFDMSKIIFIHDPIIVLFGLLGLIMVFSLKSKRKYWYLMVLFQVFGFILLLLTNHLPTHYTSFIPVFSIWAAFSLTEISKRLKKLGYKRILFILLIIIFIFQIYMLWPHLASRSALSKMRAYASANMDKNSIVLTDSRIYSGRVAWLFYDFHYLDASQFGKVLALNENLSDQGLTDVPIKFYFVECARDDCGWGTVRDGQLNKSMEQFVRSVSNQAVLEKTIFNGGGYDDQTTSRGMKPGEEYFKIRSATISLKPQILSAIDSTHFWFYYPIDYRPKEKIFDTYEVYSTTDNLMYSFAWFVTITSIILAVLMAFIPIYKVYKQK